MSKVKFTVWIDENIYKLFRDWVWKKHGKIQGVLGDETARALKLLMELEESNNSNKER